MLFNSKSNEEWFWGRCVTSHHHLFDWPWYRVWEKLSIHTEMEHWLSKRRSLPAICWVISKSTTALKDSSGLLQPASYFHILNCWNPWMRCHRQKEDHWQEIQAVKQSRFLFCLFLAQARRLAKISWTRKQKTEKYYSHCAWKINKTLYSKGKVGLFSPWSTVLHGSDSNGINAKTLYSKRSDNEK